MLDFFKDIEHSLNILIPLTPTEKVIDKQIALTYLEEIEKQIKEEQKEWKEEIEGKVSDSLPSYLVGRKRPQNRLFPYKVTGELHNSFSTNTMIIPLSGDFLKWRILASFKNESKHTFFTDEGVTKKGGNKSGGAWVDWWKKATYIDGGTIDSADKRLNNLMRKVVGLA